MAARLAQRGVGTEFKNWVLKCHKEFDMDVTFGMVGKDKEASYDDKEDMTLYDKVTYGRVEYKGPSPSLSMCAFVLPEGKSACVARR